MSVRAIPRLTQSRFLVDTELRAHPRVRGINLACDDREWSLDFSWKKPPSIRIRGGYRGGRYRFLDKSSFSEREWSILIRLSNQPAQINYGTR
jgi:hypothetical protein